MYKGIISLAPPVLNLGSRCNWADFSAYFSFIFLEFRIFRYFWFHSFTIQQTYHLIQINFLFVY